MSNVLITGGAGFVGSHVAEALLREGRSVAILDNFDAFYPAAWKRNNLDCVRKLGNPCLFESDICDEAAVERTFAAFRPSAVIHLAARAGVRPSIEHPLLYERVNVGGTAILLEAARRHHVNNFILGSSSSVYGDASPRPFHEDNYFLRPISPYAATKLAAEAMAYTYSHLFGMNVACLRFFTVYGPRQRPDLAIHKFTAAIEHDRELPVFGDGFSGRDYTYVDDIVDGVCSALRWSSNLNQRATFEIFNLGNSNPVLLNDLISALESATGKKARRKPEPPQAGDVAITWADINKAGSILGYHPKIRLQHGLTKFVAWYRDQPEDLRSR